MGRILRWSLIAGGIAVILCAGLQRNLLAGPADARAANLEAIRGVLNAQQAAWNRADVDAFLVGYWRSPEVTFSGSSGVTRGWDGVLARYKKNYPDRAAMGQL